MNFDLVVSPPAAVNLGATLLHMEQAELIRAVPEELAYLFTHALIQDTSYATLLRQKRKDLHRTVAQILEQIYADRLDSYAALLVLHYSNAGEDEKTAEYGIRAGDVAVSQYALTEARAHYTLTIEALTRLPENNTT